MERDLTAKQKKDLLDHFMKWSGGFPPDELPFTKAEAGSGVPAVNTFIRYHTKTKAQRVYLKQLWERGQ